MCSLEVWTFSMSDEKTLAIWERTILRAILGPVKGNGLWKICTNRELINLFREEDIISEIRNGRLR
jgi:hypothetical protein